MGTRLSMSLGATGKFIIIIVLLCGVVALQYGYDASAGPSSPLSVSSFTPGIIRLIDMGFTPP